MTTQTEVLKMALEVMRNQGDVSVDEWIATENAIKESLAQQSNEQVEPVASRKEFEQWCALSGHDYCFDLNEMGAYQWADAQGAYEAYWARPAFPHPPVPYVVEPRTAQPKEPAVAEQHKQEPVAWTEQRFYDDGTPNPCSALKWAGRNAENDFPVGTKFYTTPPHRKPLDIKTIKRIATYCGEHITDEDVIEITKRVEEEHKIKEEA